MTPSIDLSGQTALVTGASNGIGRATAVLLAEHGAKVFSADFRCPEEDQEHFHSLGITSLACDVRRETELASAIGAATEQTGRLDILVNNAGIGMVKPVEEVT
ncbi:MAG: SDR family NAD(P)-dependent oxidoreductase, partial [Planctomycetaceae bacterium]|nr:SDR family NAD(P)-dependent oxidoreductase [Planctomycetaceae bacterium]